MKKAQRRVGLAVLAAAVTMTVVQPGAAADQSRPTGVRTTINVVAEGLDTPRGVIFDKSRLRVLVAEAGQLAGNEGPCAAGNGGVIYCYGQTGAVFQFTEYSSPRRIATGLPSLKTQDNSAILGAHDLAVQGGRLNVVFGLSGRQSFRDALVAGGAPGAVGLAQTGVINSQGQLTPNGDLAAFEEVHNPDGRRVDSDPFGMLADQQGTIVADAAGNDLVRVNRDGSTQLLAFLPPRDFMGDPDYESVPTSVVQGPDGAYYVSELSGFPYHKGSARVLRVVPGQPATVAAEGFTNIADITFDDRGRLIVLEMATNGLVDPTDPVTGRLVRVEASGTQTTLAMAGLENPGGVAYAGTVAGISLFYVTNRTTGTGDNGQLLRLVVFG